MNVTELRAKRDALIADARKNLDELDNTSDSKRVVQLEKRHNEIMDEYDKVTSRLFTHEEVRFAEHTSRAYNAGLAGGGATESRAHLRPNRSDTPLGGKGTRLVCR